MDKIIGCSDDELVVKILSFLPTKVAVSTSVLSKQWKFLWMRVTKFDYNEFELMYRNGYKIVERMRCFIVTNLPLYSSPVIESLCLDLHTATFQPDDIRLLVETVLTRHVREISIDNSTRRGKLHTTLQSSLYTCKSLVPLKLEEMILVDVPHVVCLPSLKTLHLQCVKYADEESLQRLISNCPVLEDLVVELCGGDNVRKFAVSHPTLLSFLISDSYIHDGYVIDTPSLKYFIAREFSKISSFIVNMPKLEKADIDFNGFSDIEKFLKPVTFVKHLSLSIIYHSGELVYGDDIVFNELEHLKIHISYKNGSNVLLWLLKCSPKLRDFEFSGRIAQDGIHTSTFWKQLISVPQCLLSSLQTFKWTCNDPGTEERDLGTYILRKSCQLKTARFSTWPYPDPHRKLKRSSMKEEFLASSLGSSTCDLLFDNFDFEGSKELVFSY